ncbi:MAG: VWA domain-containing protein [Paludibacteraceae bacterium]|nr:VWA domain-containing protein [Paludibacteraceae bacterium]
MSFANPIYLIFIPVLVLPMIAWYWYELHKSDASVQISDTTALAKHPRSLRVWLLHAPFLLRIAAVVLLCWALARPQLTNHWSSESTEGIDIMIALDISGTMLAEDLTPNRLERAKKEAEEFVKNRPNDQIGLVVFAGESFTQCPLTTDHAVLVNLFKSVEYGMIEDGTAIGLGLANAVNRMKDSETKSKVIILLTDGSNNRGDIDPQTAAEIAKTFGIRVYTVGVGSYGETRVPVNTPMGRQYVKMQSEFDEVTLRGIAEKTGGQYFRATDNNSLKLIYEQIDQLEKTKLRVREYSKHTENFMPYLIAALACLLLEIVLRYFVLRTISN